MTDSGQTNQSEAIAERTPWRQIWIALVISAVGTAILGGVLLFLFDNVWWLALGGIVSLFGGGIFLGVKISEPEPLYGALLSAIYFAMAFVFIFVGSLLGELPDPLPGLAIGDSTFFFVSPLLMLIGGVAGSVAGGPAKHE